MRGEWGVYKAQRISFCHVCIAIISRYSFQSSNQETREKVQTHSSGKMVHFRGTISIKSTRERSPIRKQIMMPPRHACPVAGLVTSTQFPLVHRMLQGVEHTDPTEWSTSHLSQIVCYSRVFNFELWGVIELMIRVGDGCVNEVRKEWNKKHMIIVALLICTSGGMMDEEWWSYEMWMRLWYMMDVLTRWV